MAAGSSTALRYAIVGTGMMGIEHIQALQTLPDTHIVALCDPHAPSVAAARHALGADRDAARVYTDVETMAAAGEFDVVVLASPNHTHRALAEPLLRSGAHLLIEKPLCTTAQDCKELLALEHQTQQPGRVVWVGLEYRFMVPTMQLLAHARSGVLGNLRMLAIREHRFPFLVKVHDWNRFNVNTGGTLVEKCCHFFDLMRLVLQTYGGRTPDILDNAFVVVDFDNGARASLDLCMFAEATKNEQEISLVGDLGKAEALVTQGIVRLGLRADGWFQTNEQLVNQADLPSVLQHQGAHHGSSWREHVAMQQAIRNNMPAEVTLHDGLMSVAMGEAAHRSIAAHRPIAMSEILP